jgi:hypothetical protein
MISPVYKIFHVDWSTRQLVSVESWTDESPPLPEQAATFKKLFDAGETVVVSFLTVNSKNRLPGSISGSSAGAASLKWNKKFSIPDFGIDSAGVFGTLSFSGKAAFVFVAWESVYEISSSNGEHFSWKEKPNK